MNPQRAGVQFVAEGIGVKSNQVTRAAAASGQSPVREAAREGPLRGLSPRAPVPCVWCCAECWYCHALFSDPSLTVQNSQCRFIQDHVVVACQQQGRRRPRDWDKTFLVPWSPRPMSFTWPRPRP